MDLTTWLRTVARPRPLVVGVPGQDRVRFAVEAEMRTRGWRAATSPAEADTLLVCGEPGEELAGIVRRVWHLMSVPRARAEVTAPSAVGGAFDGVRATLCDIVAARADAERRSTGPGDGDLPGALEMAGTAEDRDGLALDVLHVAVGPVLPGWPAGLRLATVLQGDVVASAEVELVDGGPRPSGEEAKVTSLDQLAALLTVLGWEGAAGRAALLRDRAASGRSAPGDLARLDARLRSSRRVRASLRGIGGDGRYDAWDRLIALLDLAAGRGDGTALRGGVDLGGAVTGLDLGTARVVAASFLTGQLAVTAHDGGDA